jgi:hypothetical protein
VTGHPPPQPYAADLPPSIAGPRGGGGGGLGGGYPLAGASNYAPPPSNAVAPYSPPQSSTGGYGNSAGGYGSSSSSSGYGASTGGQSNCGGDLLGGGGGGYGGGNGGGGNIGGVVSSLISGVDINLADVKLIGLGYVRPQLVDSLCVRATNTLITEGEKRWVYFPNYLSLISFSCLFSCSSSSKSCPCSPFHQPTSWYMFCRVLKRFDSICHEQKKTD